MAMVGVKLHRFLGRPADDEGRPCFVDKDVVHLVNDGVVEVLLHLEARVHGHVISEVVEAKLVVGAVGNVAGVGLLAQARPLNARS